jgi:hypothetical protein
MMQFFSQNFVEAYYLATLSDGALNEWSWEGKNKYSEQNLSRCHFLHHKSHMDWLGIRPRDEMPQT